MGISPQPHLLTLEDVERMCKLNPPGPRQQAAVTWLTRHLVTSTDLDVIVQGAIVVTGGFLSPDLLVAEPIARGERTATAILAIEVAVTSHRHDHERAVRYAAAGVPVYWIVDVPGRSVAVHDELDGVGYRRVRRYVDGDTIEPPAGAPVDVTALLGEPPDRHRRNTGEEV